MLGLEIGLQVSTAHLRVRSLLIETYIPFTDEILYHARVHPEERCNVLTESQLEALHKQTAEVCRIAVEANADDSKFPEGWLFKHRWVGRISRDVLACNQASVLIKACILGKRQEAEAFNDSGTWGTLCIQDGWQSIKHRLLNIARYAQPNGAAATIKWITVGGRTSAYVAELQQLSSRGSVVVSVSRSSS